MNPLTVPDLDELEGLGAAKGRRVWYQYVVDFSDNIAAAGNAERSRQINQGGAFVVQKIHATVWIPNASGSAIAGTPAYRDPSATAASNTFMSLAHFRANLRTTDTPWSSNPVRLNLLTGDGRDPDYLLTGRWIAPNDELFATLYNDSAETVRAQIVLEGFRWYRR